MTGKDVTVDMINVVDGWVVVDSGIHLPIVEFTDAEGDLCDPEDATGIVAGTDAYGYLRIEILDERPVMQ